jgi:glycosyltransferase involved in cell wall biosynthesis
MNHIKVIIPAYNEEKAIGNVIKKFQMVLARL